MLDDEERPDVDDREDETTDSCELEQILPPDDEDHLLAKLLGSDGMRALDDNE